MNTIIYKSHPLGAYLQEFICFKQMQGYDYNVEARSLHKFDDFLVSQKYEKSILDADIINGYIGYTSKYSCKYQESCLSFLRLFSKYMNSRLPESEVLEELPVKVPDVVRFYLYSAAEVVSLMDAALWLRPTIGPLRPHCIRFLIGLLYCTGLRIGEALFLTLNDVDLANHRLTVRKGKFNKQRYVPLDQTVVARIREWLILRNSYISDAPGSPLFVTTCNNTALNYPQTERAFISCRQQCNMESEDKQPRIHDFRHTYACNCVLRWQLLGEDVNAKLPILSTALGHVDIHSTQIYLHITSAQLEHASSRFHCFYTRSNGENLS